MHARSSRSALLALGICVALAAGLAPTVSGAQPAPRQLPADPDFRAPPGPPAFERGTRRLERQAERLERRLEFLRSELGITPEQQPLWESFADAMRSEAEARRGQIAERRESFRRPEGGLPPPGIVERLERRQESLAERTEYYDRLLSALRPLYAALNENQRRAADEHLFSPGREDRFRRGPRGFGPGREFGGGRYRPFERPYGPFDPPYDRFDRFYYRY